MVELLVLQASLFVATRSGASRSIARRAVTSFGVFVMTPPRLSSRSARVVR
jgi:hypothetical protein